jgi:hypothetical protein
MSKKRAKWYRGPKRPKGAPSLARIMVGSKTMGRIFSEKKTEREEPEEIFPSVPPSKRTRLRGE